MPVPVRMCAGCGKRLPRSELIRVARSGGGAVLVDEGSVKQGRGAYLCRRRECLEAAVTRRSLERGLKVRVPDKIYQELKERMEREKNR